MSSRIKGLRRVGIVGLSTVVAASMMSFSAVSAQAAWATSGGDIGLVDTNTTADNGTQEAPLVYPGVNGQSISDMRIVIPNVFAAGDTIDLTIFDRSATNTNDGNINAGPAQRLAFNGTPTVTVNATPVSSATLVGPTSGAANNTEGRAADGDAPVAAAAGAATTAPTFTTALRFSSRAAGLQTPSPTFDIIRLTVGQLSTGTDPAAKWIITVSGVKVDVGTAVSPGALRVVPFAYNGTPASDGSNSSPVFAGNDADLVNGSAAFDPTIGVYTVPAYVAPVTFNIGAPNNLVADGTDQLVGDITIAETNNYSLGTATYTLDITGATIANTTGATSAAPVTVTKSGGGTTETVTSSATIVDADTLSFGIGAADNTTKLSVVLKGLLLNAGTTEGPITYTLSGGTIDGFLAAPGFSPAIGTPPNGVLADSAFGAASAFNQDDIEAPGLVLNAISTPIAFRIGGIDRYETAAKIATTNGSNNVVVLASGMDFPDALSSGYLASQFGASILLTKQNSLPASTIQAMRELGTKTVYVIGGTGAISAGVEAKLRATSQYAPGGTVTIGQGKLSVVRLGGADRFATNKVVNLRAAALSDDDNPVGRTQITFGEASKLTALVARGEDFADAMSGGPATAGVFGGVGQGSLPLILTKSGSLSPAASSQMTSLGIEQTVILGGTGAVSAAVATSIEALGADTHRIGGDDRFETAAMVADFEIAATTPTATTDGGLGFDRSGGATQRAYLARGDDFADALAGAPLAGGDGSPILLTNPTTLSGPTQVWLSDHSADYSRVIALGLGGAVSTAVLNAANNAIAGG